MTIEIITTETSISIIDIEDALKTVFDPDISVSIYDLGLIYKIEAIKNNVNITMTLTSANCPEAESLPELAKESIVQKLNNPEIIVNLVVVFDPPWTVDNMSEEVLLKLNLL